MNLVIGIFDESTHASVDDKEVPMFNDPFTLK